MKKLSTMFIVLLSFFSACSWIQVNPDTSEAIAKISSRRIGAKLQKNYPDIAKEVKAVCQAIVIETDNDSLTALTGHITRLLCEQIKDPILAADITDLMSLIKIAPDIEIGEVEIKLIRVIATGLKTGIEMEVD